MSIAIDTVAELARKNGLTNVVVLAHDGKTEHVATFGDTEEAARNSAAMGDQVKTFCEWPEGLKGAQPAARRAFLVCPHCLHESGEGATLKLTGCTSATVLCDNCAREYRVIFHAPLEFTCLDRDGLDLEDR